MKCLQASCKGDKLAEPAPPSHYAFVSTSPPSTEAFQYLAICHVCLTANGCCSTCVPSVCPVLLLASVLWVFCMSNMCEAIAEHKPSVPPGIITDLHLFPHPKLWSVRTHTLVVPQSTQLPAFSLCPPTGRRGHNKDSSNQWS